MVPHLTWFTAADRAGPIPQHKDTSRRPHESDPHSGIPPLLQRISGTGHRYFPGWYGLIPRVIRRISFTTVSSPRKAPTPRSVYVSISYFRPTCKCYIEFCAFFSSLCAEMHVSRLYSGQQTARRSSPAEGAFGSIFRTASSALRACLHKSRGVGRKFSRIYSA